MSANKIEIYRGDTHTITVTVTNADGTAFNLTGYTMKLTVKTNKSDPDSSALLTKDATINSPATLGKGTIALSATDTNKVAGDYWYDVQIKNANSSDVKTILLDQFNILQDITQS